MDKAEKWLFSLTLALLLGGTFVGGVLLKQDAIGLAGVGGACVAMALLIMLAIVRACTRVAPDLAAGIRRLEDAGLLTSTVYRARRAFSAAESEDEGPHYFLELDDGSVLCLTGQYLYDLEPAEQEPEPARRFPCTEFTVRRHRTNGYTVDILCRGDVLEPEAVAKPFTFREFRQDLVPEDGEVLTGRSYDEIKRERMKQ